MINQIKEALQWAISSDFSKQVLTAPDISHHHLTDQLRLLLDKAKVAQQSVHHTPLDLAVLIANYLWIHSEGIQRIEIVSPETIQYPFVMINRKGFLNERSTWGTQIVFIDPSPEHQGVFESYKTIEQHILSKLNNKNLSYQLISNYDLNLKFYPYPMPKQDATLKPGCR